jgi:hypothetical protein
LQPKLFEQGENIMNTEDDEFNRIEREAKVRMMAVRYSMEKVKEPSPIPLITDEEWAALNEIPEA